MLALQKPQATCNRCPLWQPSNRTPNSGYCPHYCEQTLGHDTAGHNCPEPLNRYKVDLFNGNTIIDEIIAFATGTKDVDAQIMALGKTCFDFDSWGTPRLCRA